MARTTRFPVLLFPCSLVVFRFFPFFFLFFGVVLVRGSSSGKEQSASFSSDAHASFFVDTNHKIAGAQGHRQKREGKKTKTLKRTLKTLSRTERGG